MSNTPQLANARRLLALGFSVIPLDHPAETRQTDPKRIGKVPALPSWKAFQTERPTDENLVSWFGNGRPCNIGIVTGALSGVVAVDCDNPEAIAWADAHLPPTPMNTKTENGEHRFFHHPGQPIRNKARVRTGDTRIAIDVRADGGYVVAPGSVRASGTVYEQLGSWPPVATLPTFDPAWMEPETPDTPAGPTRQVRRARERSDLKDRDALIRRVRAYLAATPPAIEGQGGDPHTYQVICRVVRGFDLADVDALEVLRDWNQRCVPPWTEAELLDKIKNAREYGTEPIGGRIDDSRAATRPDLSAAVKSARRQAAADVPEPEPLILDPADPLQSARAFVTHAYLVDGVVALRHQADVFYGYQPALAAYDGQDGAAIRADLYVFLEQARRWSEPKGGELKDKQAPTLAPFKPTKSKVDNVVDALRAVCNLPASTAAPCWLQDDPDLDPFDVLACRNGLLHIPTRTLLPPSPRFFTLNGLDFAFDRHAPVPAHFAKFLRELWPNDRESQETLQEVIGYLLTPRTHFQKIAMIVGPKRSGKGTIGKVVRRLLGERNVCGPTLANMSEQFGLAVLIGKSAAIIADARLSGRTDTAVITERLLSISGEDSLSVPRKFLPDWTGKLSTRFLLMTNELPRIEDASGALASRFTVLTLHQSFYGREDHGLFDRFVPELPGILNWALEGYDRLYDRGRFVQPQSSAELIQQFEDLGSPIGAFLRERCDVGHGFEATQQRVFDAWHAWCRANGRERTGTTQTLGRNLRAALPCLTVAQHRDAGPPVRYWNGLRLRGEAR